MATVRQAAHELLRQRGLTKIFGNPGSNELPFLQGLPEDFDYVLGLHEGAVVSMADGYAQVTGKPVLVNLHAASGTGNGMGALTNAVYSRTPLVITAGQQIRSAIGLEAMLSMVEPSTLTRPLTVFSTEPACAEDVPRALSQAIYESEQRKGPVFLSVPYSDWAEQAGTAAELLPTRSVDAAVTPSTEQFARLATLINQAERPALVLGGDIDAIAANQACVELAEKLRAAVFAAPSLHRLPFPNKHPLFSGVLSAGIASIADALEPHDLVLVLGAPIFRYHQNDPGHYLNRATRVLQVTDDLGAANRAPFGETLVAGVKEFLVGITPLIDARTKQNHEWLPIPEAATAAHGIHPEQVFAAIRAAVPADTRYVVESTSTNEAFWRQMDLREQGSYFFPASGGLGFGLPATVGVKLASPDRAVVGIIGDGAANYGITGLWTAATLGIPAIFVVLRNGTYGALRWFAGLLGAEDVPGLDIPGIDFVSIARGYGLDAVHANSPAECTEAMRAALLAQKPLLIEIDTTTTTPE